MSKKNREGIICITFDPKKKLDRVKIMNNLAEICRILHTNKDIHYFDIHILGEGKSAKHIFEFEIL